MDVETEKLTKNRFRENWISRLVTKENGAFCAFVQYSKNAKFYYFKIYLITFNSLISVLFSYQVNL